MFLLRRLISLPFKGDAERRDGNIGVSNPKKFPQEDALRKALDQAVEYVREGKYERALLLLEKLGQLNPGVKGVGELVAVAEVCYAAVSRPCMCSSKKSKSPDWYKILKVDENSDIEIIKKRYRQLALLLHPDKNKHVKAEGAFKLVSEAYACLSDEKRRANFNTERLRQQCRRCSQTDVATRSPDRWCSYDCSRERKTNFRRARSVPDITEADWVLDQEKLKIFREKARARVLSNLAEAWKERLYKSIGEFPLARLKSLDRKRHKNVPAKDDKCPEHEHLPQQKLNIEEQCMGKSKQASTKPALSPKCMNRVMDESHETHSKFIPTEVADEARTRIVSDFKVSRPCKSLEVLICELRAELNANSKSTSDQKSQQCSKRQQELVAENSTKKDSNALFNGGTCPEKICTVGNSVELGGAEADGPSQKMQSATGNTSAALQRQMNTFMAADVIQQATDYQAAHDCSSASASSHPDLSHFSEKQCFNLNEKFAKQSHSVNLFPKSISSSTNVWGHKEGGNTGASPDSLSDPCTECIENKHQAHYEQTSLPPIESKLVEENCTSGATSANTFLEDLLKQRTAGTDHSNVERTADQFSPLVHTNCTNDLSNRRVCRGDSLDREETILQTQKEKSDQLLRTLQRLREEAKTVAASLNHIRKDRDNEGARCSFKTFFAAPAYQTFVWDASG